MTTQTMNNFETLDLETLANAEGADVAGEVLLNKEQLQELVMVYDQVSKHVLGKVLSQEQLEVLSQGVLVMEQHAGGDGLCLI